DGRWAEVLQAQDIEVTPLKAANCGFKAAWSEVFRSFEGKPLKGIALSFGSRSVRGEAMVTREGLEGGAVYALSSPIRDAIEKNGEAVIAIDLMPETSAAKLSERLAKPRAKQSLSNFLRKATHLSPVALALLRETALASKLTLPAMNADTLAALIKAAPVRLIGVQPIETAISTAGGISFSELDAGFMLKRYPGIFAAGEMLDWDAPTGGYLLQASFATGAAAARGAIAWLRRN
ncbi:MAG: TIGR03862 family flavoprotein, partial [Pseudolabrys sp.]